MTIAYENVHAVLNRQQQSDLWRLFDAMCPDGRNITPYMAKALKSVLQLAHTWRENRREVIGLWKTDGPAGALQIRLDKSDLLVDMCEIDKREWSHQLSDRQPTPHLMAA